jgi:hypothetical protein
MIEYYARLLLMDLENNVVVSFSLVLKRTQEEDKENAQTQSCTPWSPVRLRETRGDQFYYCLDPVKQKMTVLIVSIRSRYYD